MGASKEIFMEMREQEMTQAEGLPSIAETFSKSTQIAMADRFTAKVNEGAENPLDAFIRLRNIEKALEIALDRLKPLALIEGEKLAKSGEKVHGVHVSVVGGKRTFDYSNDKIWNEVKEKLKEREEFLKGLKKEMADVDTGEIISPPVIKYYSETLYLKFD